RRLPRRFNVSRGALVLVVAFAASGDRCHPQTQPVIVPPSLGQQGDSALQAIARECSDTLAYATRFKKSPQASNGLASAQINAYNSLVLKLNGLLDRIEHDEQTSDQDLLSAAVDIVGDNV